MKLVEMNLIEKENKKTAAILRRSLLAERQRLRQEWAHLKETAEGATTSAEVLKKRTHNNVNKLHKIVCKPTVVKEPSKPQPASDALCGVVALVEVGSESRALALRAALSALGASVVPTWSPLVTHLIWANGGCRATRAKARALASRLVSPLWVEACAASNSRLPERTFPAAARESDLPSPATLRRLLKKAEMENIPLIDLLSDSKEGSQQKPMRLRISSEHSSSDASSESTDVEPETRVNTAPRRALPASTSPSNPKRARRKLFTPREPASDSEASVFSLSPPAILPPPFIRPPPVVTPTLPSQELGVGVLCGQEMGYLSTDVEPETRVNTAPRRALPASTSPSNPKRARRKLFTPREPASDSEASDVEPETRVNTAPRRALPASTSPSKPKRARRKLFTPREPASDSEASEEEEPKHKHNDSMITQWNKKNLARAERMAKRLAGVTPVKPKRTVATQTQERPRIVLTGMTRIERAAVTAAICSLNGKIKAHVTRKTTHVLLGSCREHPEKDSNITGVNDLNTSTKSIQEIPKCDRRGRTLNALLGAARGCRVLYAQWALDSFKVKKWLHHVGYEVPHLKKISQKARVERKATRLMHADYAYDVFNGMRVRISSDVTHKVAAVKLLDLCGAVIINQNGGTSQNGRPCLTQYGRTQNGGRTDHDIVLGDWENEVNSKWVFDSVAAGRMRTTRKYVNSFYDAITLAVYNLCD